MKSKTRRKRAFARFHPRIYSYLGEEILEKFSFLFNN